MGKAYGGQRNINPDLLSKRPEVTNVDFKDQSLFDTLYNHGTKENAELRECL